MATPHPGQNPPLDDCLFRTQGAAPDPRIPADTYVPPVHSPRSAPDDLLPEATAALALHTAVRPPAGGTFPFGRQWEVNAENAAAWAAHRFEGHFTDRVLERLGNPDGHPLFELRLDLLEYEVLFARFVGMPHNPATVRCRYDPRTGQAGERLPGLRCLPWMPPSEALRACLQESCREYAAGLARYLRPGREHWGGGAVGYFYTSVDPEEEPDVWDTL